MAFLRYLPAFSLLIIASCDQPACRRSSPLFDQFTPDKPVYKAELARQIRRVGPENLRFWFDSYVKREGHEHIIADVQGPGICAKAELLVTDWEGIQGLRGAAPSGYRGAELKGLKMAVEGDGDGVIFLYQGLERIVD